MRIQIDFTNGTQPVDYKGPEHTRFMPYELKITSGGSATREKVITNYLQQFDYAFRCLNNNVDDKISSLQIKDLPFLKGINKGKNVFFGDAVVNEETNKYDIVIYDITAGVVVEKMYLTRNKDTEQSMFLRKELNYSKLYSKQENDRDEEEIEYEEQYNRKIMIRQLGEETALNIINLNYITMQYIKGYSLKWNPVMQRIQIMSNNQVISYDKIKNPGTYTFFKLIPLIFEKGKHIGVFYINALQINKDELKAILSLIDLIYKEKALVFLYNATYVQGIEREVIELPNYLLVDKNKKKGR